MIVYKIINIVIVIVAQNKRFKNIASRWNLGSNGLV